MIARDPFQHALDQLSRYGLEIDALDTSGRLRRVRHRDDRPGKKDGWYVAYEVTANDGRRLIAGAYGWWKDDQSPHKLSFSTAGLSETDRQALRERQRQAKTAHDAERAALGKQAAEKAARIWADLPQEGRSAYLQRKKIAAYGLRFSRGAVVVPLRDVNRAWRGLQFIDKEGTKRFLTGTEKKGAFHVIGDIAPDGVLGVAEGYATAATVHKATGWPVAVAFDAGNLEPVCGALRASYPQVRLVVCGDDDFQTRGNPGRTKAERAAEKARGEARFPAFSGEQGTDWNDLHVSEGLEAVKTQLEKAAVTAASAPHGVSRLVFSLDVLLQQYAIIHGNGMVWDGDHGRLMRLDHLRTSAGTKLVEAWLNHPERRIVDQSAIVFDPAGDADPQTTVNLYSGFDLEPDSAGEKKCRRLLDHLYFLCGEDDDAYWWVLRWIAYPLQNPGAKMQTSIVLHGAEGTGKNLFWEALARIYDRYSLVISQSEIESDFNGWASGKLFCIADEVISRSELRHMKGKLKGLITGSTIQINEKNQPLRTEANHMNLVFLSNEEQPLVLDPGDRRYTVLRCDQVRDEKYYTGVAWEIANGGVGALFHYLLNLELDGFNHHAKPYRNGDRDSLIDISRPSAERFYAAWAAGMLAVPYQACTASDLYHSYRAWCRAHGERLPATETRFGREVSKRERKDRKDMMLGDDMRRRKYRLYVPESDMSESVETQAQQFHTALIDWVKEIKAVAI